MNPQLPSNQTPPPDDRALLEQIATTQTQMAEEQKKTAIFVDRLQDYLGEFSIESPLLKKPLALGASHQIPIA